MYEQLVQLQFVLTLYSAAYFDLCVIFHIMYLVWILVNFTMCHTVASLISGYLHTEGVFNICQHQIRNLCVNSRLFSSLISLHYFKQSLKK